MPIAGPTKGEASQPIRTPRAGAIALLALAAIAIVGWWALATSGEGPQPFQPFIFIHASDPQISGGTAIAEIRDRFIALARQANAIQPAFVLVTGDLVNDGDNAPQLAAFEEALREFRVPVHLLPGNHDDLVAYRARFGADYSRFTCNNCEFICLDSTALTTSMEQWRWLEQSLLDARRAGRTHIFLAMHHPPQELAAKERIERLIRDYGVHVVFAGHLHRTVEIPGDGYTTYVVSGTDYPRDQSGYGYAVVTVTQEGVTRKCLRLDAPAAGPASAPSRAPASMEAATQTGRR